MGTTLLNRITTNPAVLSGKSIKRGMRISIEHVIKMLASGIAHADIMEEYPCLEEGDIRASMLFAAKKISNEEEMAA